MKENFNLRRQVSSSKIMKVLVGHTAKENILQLDLAIWPDCSQWDVSGSNVCNF